MGDGKSTNAANLGAAHAAGGLRVVIVAADLRRPSLGKFLDVSDDGPGLTSVLMGDATVGECLVPTQSADGTAFGYLPPGPLPANPPALLGSDAFNRLLDRIDEAGVDVILLDCPPVLPVSDALVAAQNVDGILLVAAVNQTKKSQLLETVDRLDEVEAKVVGVVVNGVEPTKERYYESDYKQATPSAPNRADAGVDTRPPPPNGNGSAAGQSTPGPSTERPGDAGSSVPARPTPD